VADTGGGIDPANIDKIFEPYFTTKEAGKGTGLGLAVVDGIVRDHGGFITVDNHPGKGCAFNVFFPMIPSRTPPDAPPPKPVYPTGSERVLLVDDEPPILEMIRRMLEGLGYAVTSAEDGTDALALFCADPHRFDLIFTDMTMPRMTGERLAREVKAIRPDMPVIICTGFSENMNPDRSRELGLSGCLLKPILRSDLAAAVRSALDSGRVEGR
jgi:CheY-like chemotaxis protein